MAVSVVAELKATTTEFMAKMKEAQAEVGKLSTKGSGSFEKLATVGKAALLGVAGAAVSIGGLSLEMADTFEKANARLEGAIANTGGSFEEYKKQIDGANSKLEKYGYTNADTADALATLTNATRSPAKALSEVSLAADIARGRNISLADASLLLAKVNTGNVSLLSRYGIATKDATGKVISQQAAVAALTKMYGGDAKRSAETFAGKTLALKTQLQDVGAKIGLALIPVIMKLAGVVSNIVKWFQEHATVAKILAGIVGTVLVVAIAAYTASMISAAVATIAATWPILLIIAAVAAVAIAAYELATHWSEVWNGIKAVVGDVVNALSMAWNAIVSGLRTAWSAVWGFLKTWGPVALAVLAPFIGIPLLIWQHFDQIKTFLANAFSAAYDTVKHWIGTIIGVVESIPGRILSVGSSLLHAGASIIGDFFHGIESAGSAVGKFVGDIVGDIKNSINNVMGLPWKIPRVELPTSPWTTVGFGPWTLIPRLAKGGIVPATPGGRLILAGEGGSDEAVVPLDGRHGIGGGGPMTFVFQLDGRTFATAMFQHGQQMANAGTVLLPAKAIA